MGEVGLVFLLTTKTKSGEGWTFWGECRQIMNCGEFEDFGVDQRKRHDYEMSVAPRELYLGGGLTGLHLRGSPSLQEIFQRPWQGTTT